jgi:hypothetical protein
MCIQYVIAGIQAASTIAGGFAEAKSYKAQAKIAQQQGLHSARIASERGQALRYSNLRAAAGQRVAMYTRGVDPASASAFDVLAEDWGNRALDELNQYYQGRLALYEGNEKARQLKQSAKTAVYSSLLNAGGTLLGNAISEKWLQRTEPPLSVGQQAGSGARGIRTDDVFRGWPHLKVG